jgi:hypothetical protein
VLVQHARVTPGVLGTALATGNPLALRVQQSLLDQLRGSSRLRRMRG